MSLPKHTQVYFDFFGVDESSYISCELCEAKSNQIHHIKSGAHGRKNNIENLAAVCFSCHDKIHNREGGKALNEKLKIIHETKISNIKK